MISQNGSRINQPFQKGREIGGREEERKERGKEGKTKKCLHIQTGKLTEMEAITKINRYYRVE